MRTDLAMNAALPAAGAEDLSALRLAARQGSPDAAKEAAVQFEALFIQMMLGEMRRGDALGGGLFDSAESDMYHQMFDQRIAEQMSRAGGIGLAESLHRQLGVGATVDAREDRGALALPERPVASRPLPDAPPILPEVEAAVAHASVPAATADNESDTQSSPAWPPASPDEFVSALTPHARRAGERLGVAPEVLIAQAALETGWGHHMIRGDEGQQSFNLFGVKSGGGWEGQRVSVPTLEYRDGVARRERAEFRVYDGLAESFDDYAALLERLPRYRPALEQAGDARGFLEGLQHGGYATDPRYAEKVLAIVERGLPEPALSARADADEPPERG